MNPWLALTLSTLPGLFWLIYVESQAPRRSAPLRLAAALMAGAGSAQGVLWLHGALNRAGWPLEQPAGVWPQLLFFVVGVGLVEESCKLAGAGLLRAVLRPAVQAGVWGGLVDASAVALGFATAENVSYVLGSGKPTILVGRFLLSTFAHVCMSGIWGAALFEARRRPGALLASLLWAAALHGAYDWFLTIGWASLALLVYAGLGWLYRLRLQESFYSSAQRQPVSQRVRECGACRTLGRMEYRFCPDCGADEYRQPILCLSCLKPTDSESASCQACGCRFF